MNTFGTIFSVFFIGLIVVFIILFIKRKVKLMLNPIFAIFLGIMTVFPVNFILVTLTPTTHSILAPVLKLVFSIFIGAFVATFFSRENNMLYGIFVAVFFLIFALIVFNIELTNNNEMDMIINFIELIFVPFILSVIMGGFIAKRYKEFIIKKT
jgi:hypothetical protein